MNRIQKRKANKKRIIALANDGRKFKSEESKEKWIKDTYAGLGIFFTKYYLKGYPESPLN